MNISSVDLNLLTAFEALLEERNVTRAAKRVHLSQPAMSNALARLRVLFEDPLFKRVSRGITPTTRALELAGPVRGGLALLRAAFDERRVFNPAGSGRTFRLAMSDYSELRVLPGLMRRISSFSPHIQVLVRRTERVFFPPEDDLRSGAIDTAIGFFPEDSALNAGTRAMDLLTEENVCIFRRGNPLLRKRFGLREFASAGHVGIFYRFESRGLIDNILAGHGLRRRLQTATPHFLAAPFLVAESDLVAVVPAGLAMRARKSLPIEIRKVPFDLPPLRMRVLWHENVEEDPAHVWFIEQLRPRVEDGRGKR